MIIQIRCADRNFSRENFQIFCMIKFTPEFFLNIFPQNPSKLKIFWRRGPPIQGHSTPKWSPSHILTMNQAFN